MASGKKRSNKVFLYVILIVAILAALAYLLLSNNPSHPVNQPPAATPTPNYELVEIVVASQSIPTGCGDHQRCSHDYSLPKNGVTRKELSSKQLKKPLEPRQNIILTLAYH